MAAVAGLIAWLCDLEAGIASDAVVGHAGTVGLIVEISAAVGIAALALAAWVGTRKERH